MQVQNMIKSYDLRNRVKSPWPYYKLINVQWSAHPIVLGNPPVKLPLPEGMPTTTRLTNPVEETFQQAPDVSCMTCHRAFASIAKNPDIASGFILLFERPIRVGDQFIPDLPQETFRAAFLDGLEREPVNSGCPVVAFRHPVGFLERFHLADMDVQPPETPSRFSLRLDV